MDLRFAFWSRFLLLLLVVLCAYENEARDISEGTNVLRLPRIDTHQGMHTSSQMDHIPAASRLFFHIEDLTAGKTMPFYFPRSNPSSNPHLLPKEKADTIPFSLKELQHLLQIFSYSKDSPQAKYMEATLTTCESEAVKGETKFCATSLESMLDFTRNVFGLETPIKALSTIRLIKSTHNNSPLQNYTVLLDPQEIPVTKTVACHTMSYPYTIFHCHSQQGMSRVFKILLQAENNGDLIQAASLCHMDTSLWDPNHISFRILGIKRGESPVCHVFPEDNLLWVSSNALV